MHESLDAHRTDWVRIETATLPETLAELVEEPNVGAPDLTQQHSTRPGRA